MQSFDYVNATTLEQAVAVLYREGELARPLAGGTDIIVQIREGRKQAKVVVNIKGIPRLSELHYSPDRGLIIGAATPMHRIYGTPEIAKAYPGLMDAFSLVGGVAIQGRASIGGNLCTASPAGDTIPALIAHGAVCVIAGPDGWHELPVAEFCTGPGKNALQRGEILVEVRVPPTGGEGSFGAAYLRFIPRNEMDIAVASAGVSVRVKDNKITRAVVALGAVGPTPIVCNVAAQALLDRSVDDTLAHTAAGEAAAAQAKPITDMRGTMAQRRHLAGVLTLRALAIALERAH
jgi:carbon-monoxide dehydrogenase medium subunit